MRLSYLRSILSILTLTFVLLISFQNCSEGGGDKAVSFASASLTTVLIEMNYNGGPGLYEGARVEFQVSLDPDAYLLQWYFQAPGQRHGFPIDQANGNTYVIDKIQLNQEGKYWLAVTDESGERVISNKITLEVQPSQLKTQPSNEVTSEGGDVQFVAEVINGTDISYRWEWKRPGVREFEPMPVDDPQITGVKDNVLMINGVKTSKHVALYRLKLTDRGDEDRDSRVFYSQQVHLTVLKTNLPANKNNVKFDSSHTLTFEAIGIRRTGNGSVSLTSGEDIQWQRWDRNTDQFENIMIGDKILTGTQLQIKNANPRFTKYRARLLTKNNGSYYSQTTAMKYAGEYKEPWIELTSVGSRIRYTKMSNGKYEVKDTPTFLRTNQTLHSAAVAGAARTWHRKRPDDSGWVLIKDGDNLYSGDRREIKGHWDEDTAWVEHRVNLSDKFGVTSFATPVAIHNGEEHPSVTIRFPVGTERDLLTNIKVHNAAGDEIRDAHEVEITWQKKNASGGWDAMGNPSETSKTITMKENSPDLREYRVRYKNTKGASGRLVNYHYFRVFKKQ